MLLAFLCGFRTFCIGNIFHIEESPLDTDSLKVFITILPFARI